MNTATLAEALRPAFPQPQVIFHRDRTTGLALNHDRREGEAHAYPWGRQPFSYTAIKLWARAKGWETRIETVQGCRSLSVYIGGERHCMMRGTKGRGR